MQDRSYFVYMMTNQNNRVLYTGVTNDLIRRVHEHRTKRIQGFTAKYNVDKLVFFESTSDIVAAISREKQIKGWSRAKKNKLVASINSSWKDLSLDFLSL
jgi:Predicted endonuclease containing a URI domain